MSAIDETVPAYEAIVPVLSDSANEPREARGLYVGVSGNVKITQPNGQPATYVGLAAGIIHPIRSVRVWSTGTTATSILVIY